MRYQDKHQEASFIGKETMSYQEFLDKRNKEEKSKAEKEKQSKEDVEDGTVTKVHKK